MRENFVKRKIYLDYASTSPVDPRVEKVMLPYLREKYGNTMSLHYLGQEAKVALEESRKIIADLLSAKSQEIVFTSSATESNNLALKGIAFANKRRGQHIIISSIEHESVMEPAKWLEKQGFQISKVKVDRTGLVDLQELEKTIRKDTILVSIMQANNEIGTLQPVAEIGKLIKRKSEMLNLKSKIYFHTDAAQSFGKIPINVKEMEIDLLTASSHKIYGPKGAACLFVREGTKIEPLLHGGGHEQGLRSSTINLPAIVGFASAAQISKQEEKEERRRISKLREKFIKGVLEKISNVQLNGHQELCLPHIVNFTFRGVEGETLVIKLDLKGIFISTGSACSLATLKPSHVLLALGLSKKEALSSVRFSFGRQTKEEDIDYLLAVLPKVIKELRR